MKALRSSGSTRHRAALSAPPTLIARSSPVAMSCLIHQLVTPMTMAASFVVSRVSSRLRGLSAIVVFVVSRDYRWCEIVAMRVVSCCYFPLRHEQKTRHD